MAISNLKKDYNTVSVKPKQRIPTAQKDKDWIEANGNYYRNACKNAIDSIEALKLYKLANGELDPSDYSFVLNPLNTTNNKLKSYPAQMRNYDIISPILNIYMGDKKNRSFPPVVLAQNSKFEEIKQEKYTAEIIQELQKIFINETRNLGIPLEEQQLKTLQGIEKSIKNIPDTLAEMGFDTLEYIISMNNIPRHFRKGFYDFCTTAMVFSYKDINKDEYFYQIISPMNFKYLISDNEDFIEDGEAACATFYMTANEIYDKFKNFKRYEEIADYIDSQADQDGSVNGNNKIPYFAYSDAISQQHSLFEKLGISTGAKENQNGIRVEHVVWRSYEEVGDIKIVNDYFEEEIIIVDRSYKPWSEVENIRQEEQIYEDFIINDEYHIGGGPIPIYRGRKAKLPYNGRNYSTRHTIPQSIVKKGEPYQKTVNIIRYNVEKMLSKNLDKLTVFPLSLIPNKEGYDEKSVIYYAQALSFLFVDDTSPNFATAVQALKSIDMGLGQYIIQAYNLIRETKEEWEEVAGISPQRKASISTSAGKGTTEAAIQRSFVISEELFTEFEEWEEKEYNGFLELSKYAFPEGKKAHFVRSTGETAFLNIEDVNGFLLADYKVFIKNNTKIKSQLEELRGNVQAFAQNQSKPSLVAKVIHEDNYQVLLNYMQEMEEEMEARTEQQSQADRDSQERIQAQISEDKQKELDFKYYEVDANNQNDTEVALIKDTRTVIKQEIDGRQTPTDDNFGFSNPDRMSKVQDNLTKLLEMKVKREEIASKERIAKDNNKTALKNRVSGEK